MNWLPYNEFPKRYLAVHIYLLLLLVPVLLHDLIRRGRIRSEQTQSRPPTLGVAANKHRAVLCKRQLASTYGTTSSRCVMSGVFPWTPATRIAQMSE